MTLELALPCEVADSLIKPEELFKEEYADYLQRGIHVMVSQNQARELTVGDSHEYGLTHNPFDKQFINRMILHYLKQFACLEDESIIETWNGIYPKLISGKTNFIIEPEAGLLLL